MHTFDSYILRQATKPLLTAVVVALLLLLVERMMRLLDFVLDSRGTLDVLLQLLTVLVPHDASEDAEAVVARIKTRVDKPGNCTATIGNVNVSITADGTWDVAR